jgi:hypothetical protein
VKKKGGGPFEPPPAVDYWKPGSFGPAFVRRTAQYRAVKLTSQVCGAP